MIRFIRHQLLGHPTWEEREEANAHGSETEDLLALLRAKAVQLGDLEFGQHLSRVLKVVRKGEMGR